MCATCGDRGYVLWVYPAAKPMPAYWFTRGPRGERPIECDCQAEWVWQGRLHPLMHDRQGANGEG